MTHNQLQYAQNIESKRHAIAVEQETKRYNLVQEQLKKIDQDLQRDLNAINEKYKEKQYQLDKHDQEFRHRMTEISNQQKERQLDIDAARVQTSMQSNYLNQLAIQENIRSNKQRESMEQQRIDLDRMTIPSKIENIQSQTQLNYVNMGSEEQRRRLLIQQTDTEAKRRDLMTSQIFGNYLNPIVNIGGKLLTSFLLK